MFGHNKDDDDTNQEPVADSSLDSGNSAVADLSGSDDSVLSDTSSVSDFSSPTVTPTTSAEPEENKEEEELLPAHASGSSWDDSSSTKHQEPNESSATNDLLDIKQKALTQLSPLVSHLDQNPEERFKTIMMMIQAADNQTLIPDAYAAAQAIPDEKVKAQALLDVVNEINYFTQQQNKS